MSKRVKGRLPYLQVVVKCKPKLRKGLIDNVPADVITTICECSRRLLKGIIPNNTASKATFISLKNTSPCFSEYESVKKAEKTVPKPKRWEFIDRYLTCAVLGSLLMK